MGLRTMMIMIMIMMYFMVGWLRILRSQTLRNNIDDSHRGWPNNSVLAAAGSATCDVSTCVCGVYSDISVSQLQVMLVPVDPLRQCIIYALIWIHV